MHREVVAVELGWNHRVCLCPDLSFPDAGCIFINILWCGSARGLYLWTKTNNRCSKELISAQLAKWWSVPSVISPLSMVDHVAGLGTTLTVWSCMVNTIPEKGQGHSANGYKSGHKSDPPVITNSSPGSVGQTRCIHHGTRDTRDFEVLLLQS